jgi:hypothetical protein
MKTLWLIFNCAILDYDYYYAASSGNNTVHMSLHYISASYFQTLLRC